MAEQSQIDISSVVGQFDKWHVAMVSLQTARSALEDKLEAIQKENKDLQQKNSKLQKELGEMQEMTTSICKQLHHVCHLEDEVKSLKAEVQSKNVAAVDLQKEMDKLKTYQKAKLDEMEEIRAAELRTAVETAEKQGRDREEQLNGEIADRDGTIQSLQDQLEKAASDRQAEVVRVTMEYESKINRLQRQKAQNIGVQSSAATQEIFRKKLQFIKAESEKEIADLKRTMAELQQKLANVQREPTKLSLSMGKKRRY